MRTRQIIKAVRNKYQEVTQDHQSLPVFGVSNRAYAQYQHGYEKDQTPRLSLQATQIPALRGHLRIATGEGRFNEAIFNVEVQLPLLLNSFDLWCAKTHMKRRKEIEAIVIAPFETFPGILEECFNTLKMHFQSKIYLAIKLKEAEWNEKARVVCEAWNKDYKGSTYLSLIRKNGIRKGNKKNVEVNWNKELIKIMSDDMKAAFDGLMKTCTQLEQPIGTQLDELMEGVKQNVRADPQATLMALTPFLRSIDLTKAEMQHVVETCFRVLKRRLNHVILNATTDCATSCLGQTMERVYEEEAGLIKGSGSSVKRPQKVINMVTQTTGLWITTADTIRENFMEVLNLRHKYFFRDVDAIFRRIHRGFDSCCQDKDVHDPEEEILRKRLSVNVVLARKILEGDLTDAFEECKAYR